MSKYLYQRCPSHLGGCGLSKPQTTTYFDEDHHTGDGFAILCRECRHIRDLAIARQTRLDGLRQRLAPLPTRAPHLIAISTPTPTPTPDRRCKVCQIPKPTTYENFDIDLRRGDGLSTACLDCLIERDACSLRAQRLAKRACARNKRKGATE